MSFTSKVVNFTHSMRLGLLPWYEITAICPAPEFCIKLSDDYFGPTRIAAGRVAGSLPAACNAACIATM